ncbi:9596_t:CDS:2, partial [Gigaspora rosea]
QEMLNNKLSQVYQMIIQDFEEVLKSNFFKEDATRVLKNIRDIWVVKKGNSEILVNNNEDLEEKGIELNLEVVLNKLLTICFEALKWLPGFETPKPKSNSPLKVINGGNDLGHTYEISNLRYCYQNKTRNKKDNNEVFVHYSKLADRKDVTEMSNSGNVVCIAKVTNAEVDKWAEESVNGEPSVRRSPRPMKCVNYAEDNSDEERKMRRVNSTAHSQSTESPQSRTPPQAPWDLSPLKTTPNKQPQNKEEI